MPYIDEETRFPLLFNFADDTLNKDDELMMAIITPQAIPVNKFSSGKTPTSPMNSTTHRQYHVNWPLDSYQLNFVLPM
jgi:hypothetical protein